MGSKKEKNNGKAWLKKEVRPYGGAVFFLTLLSAVVALLSIAFAYLVRYLINSASDKNKNALLIFALVLLSVLLLKIILKTLEGFFAERVRARMYTQLRTNTFSKLLRVDYSSAQGYHSGELLNRLTADVQEVCVDTVGFAPAIAGMAVQCVGAIVALLTIDPLFTGIYVVGGAVLVGLTSLFRKQIKKRQKAVLEADGKTRSFIQEGLSSIMTVKAYGAENATAKKEEGLENVYYEKRMQRNVLRSEMSFIFSLLSNFGLIFAVVWCSISVLGGNTDYGSILSVILLLMQLQQPLTSVSSLIPVYYARATSAERLSELDELPFDEDCKDKEEITRVYNGLQSISFENLSFSYGRESVFEGIDLSIEKGEIVCLTGASGAGKSTLFKLLLNMFQPTEGKIRLEGTFEETIPLTSAYRGLFAYVPQGNFLLSGTIHENLTFFAEAMGEKKTEAEIERAIRLSCAEFIYDLPEGLQTKLGEGGVGLSEGQLQRLNVARAILSDRPVLLLDEATSALDGETELRLLENIRSLQDKTCLIITHRPAGLDIADRILTVENGTIK